MTKLLGFVRASPLIRLQDLGSGCGTLIKLSNKRGRKIQVDDYYMIGADIEFKITAISQDVFDERDLKWKSKFVDQCCGSSVVKSHLAAPSQMAPKNYLAFNMKG